MMSLIGIAIGLIAVGIVLAVGTDEADDIGWLLVVAGVVMLVVVTVMASTSRRRP